MTAPVRLFVPADLRAGIIVAASPEQARYLVRVMRRAAGDPVLLFNGRDGEWLARLATDGRSLAVDRQTRVQLREPDLWLLFSIIRRDATEWLVQKATELGVSAIHPVLTERSNPARPNTQRLALIATEAAEQCERLSVPAIRQLRPLRAVMADWPSGRALVVAEERAAAPPPPALAGAGALLIGPEGGFAPAELDAMRGAAFVVAASLGPRILRAETAAIVGLTLLQAHPA